MTNRPELRKELDRILRKNETADIFPPWSILPQGHPDWLDLKAQRILALFDTELDNAKVRGLEAGKALEKKRIIELLDDACENTAYYDSRMGRVFEIIDGLKGG